MIHWKFRSGKQYNKIRLNEEDGGSLTPVELKKRMMEDVACWPSCVTANILIEHWQTGERFDVNSSTVRIPKNTCVDITRVSDNNPPIVHKIRKDKSLIFFNFSPHHPHCPFACIKEKEKMSDEQQQQQIVEEEKYEPSLVASIEIGAVEAVGELTEAVATGLIKYGGHKMNVSEAIVDAAVKEVDEVIESLEDKLEKKIIDHDKKKQSQKKKGQAK